MLDILAPIKSSIAWIYLFALSGRSLKLPGSNGTKKKNNMVKLVKRAVKKGRAMRATT